MPAHEAVAIVGTGAIGTALAHAFRRAGVPVAVVASRRPEAAQALAADVGSAGSSVRDAGRAAPVVILAVSDAAIETAAATIESGPGTLVVHTSGSRDIAALAAARARGSDIGGFHPLAAVARGATGRRRNPESFAAAFAGAAFAIEGDDTVATRLFALAAAIGGHPFRIQGAAKPRYHLGASMLAAFSAGLAQVSWEELRRAGADAATASAGVAHLLRTVAANIEIAAQPAAALTGPVSRGDPEGVVRQARAVRALSADVQSLYRVHVAHNIVLARHAGLVEAAIADRMLDAIAQEQPGADAGVTA